MDSKESGKSVKDFNHLHCNEDTKYIKMVKIGQGTFGEVFKARDGNNPSKVVAMKRVLMENQTEGFPMNVLREIRILQLLKHNNIVNLIEVCSSKTSKRNELATFFLVFDFCEHDLAGLLFNANVKLLLGHIKGVMRQLLNALYFIHSNKILHRDIKPANILMTKAGVLKLADFGLARPITTRQGQINRYTNNVVSLWYRPPELLLGDRDYGTPVDLWSAGCIMAEMFTRYAILPGDTEQEQLNLISQLCGSINKEVWPKVQNLELYKSIKLPSGQKRKVIELLDPYTKDVHACDLLDKLLTLDPSKRCDANSALDHDFFWRDPMPSDLSEMLSQHTQSLFEFRPGMPGHHMTVQQQSLLQEPKNSSTSYSGYQDRIF